MFALIRLKYRLGQLTALQVWGYADSGVITRSQAIVICGARPVA